MHSTQRHIHSLWFHTIVVITFHPLHSWHHTPYIWYHTHGNKNILSAIWHTISNTTSTLSVSSKPGYQLQHTHSLYDITHIIYMWHHIQHACYHIKCLWHYTPLYITSHPVYLWHHIQYVCYHDTAFMTTQCLYMTTHPLYLTSQPLCLCHHTHGTHMSIDESL